MITSPHELEWNLGSLPPAEESIGGSILAWIRK